MTSLSGGTPQPMRSPWSFMGSVCLHAWVLAWVALGSPVVSLERQRSLYEREIQPNETRIVWYKLSDRLPDVTPPEAKPNPRPVRAKTRFQQNIAAGTNDNARPPQLILAPAPEITPPKPLPLPNIVAVAPPRRPVLPFVPPPVKAPAAEMAPVLPDAPKLAVAEPKALPIDVKPPRPVRRFVPPPVKAPARVTAAEEAPALPEAPKLAMAAEPKALPIDVKAPRPVRQFTPPTVPKRPLPPDPAPLPAAPELAASNPAAGPVPKLPRRFVAPVARPKQAAAAEPATIAAPPPALVSAASVPSETTLVIAGLNPTNAVEVPAPPGSVDGAFSGGPKPQPTGADGAPSGAMLEIPSLTIQGGARKPQPPVMVARVSPTSPEGLAAALRMAHPAASAAPPAGGSTRQAALATRPPDPRMYGRQVYTMAIQTPNLTSHSGSWLIWFAAREAEAGDAPIDMRPPLPLRMVDPKYIASAADERVEGKVRLWAVIGKDGHVANVALVQHLDDRLDHSAE